VRGDIHMNHDLRELYQQVIIDHNKKPRNFREMENADRVVEGYNPLCGDKLKLFLKIEDGVIQDASFQGEGCAISKASSSMMTDSVKGKKEAEALDLFQEMRSMLSRKLGDSFDQDKLGKLSVFSGVCEFPARVKCAVLPWHALNEAIAQTGAEVTTE